MAIAEKRWLLSVVTSVVLAVTMLCVPMTVFAADGGGTSDKAFTYVNSDGQEVEATYQTDDGIVYHIKDLNADIELEEGESEPDPMLVAEVLGDLNATGKTEIVIPETLGGYNVYSVAIDSRYPVSDESYDSIKTISLPKTLGDHHYLRFFEALTTVNVDSDNEYYKNFGTDGVLYYEDTDEGDLMCGVEFYPRGKTDTTYVMPEEVTDSYGFYEGCPVESIKINSKLDYFSTWMVRNLDNLKEISVSEENEVLFAKDGVLFSKETYESTDDDGNDITVTNNYLECYPKAKSGKEYTVPKGTTYISDEAFEDVSALEKVALAESLLDTDCEFFGCTNLQTIEFISKQAPEPGWFYGIRYALRTNPELEIVYPENGTGYERFVGWLHGAEMNYWTQAAYGTADDPFRLTKGGNLNFGFHADYGDSTKYYMFSTEEDGVYTESMPDGVDTIYYMKAYVDATSEYTGLESDPVAFMFVTPDVDEETGKYANYITSGPVQTYYGEDYFVDANVTFGEPRIEYRDAEDDNSEWTSEQPTEVGRYFFKITVDETDTYNGAEWISSKEIYSYTEYDEENEEDIKIESPVDIRILPAEGELYVHCDDITEGEALEPELELDIWDGGNLDWLLDQVEYTYYVFVGENDEGNEIWEELNAIPTEPGDYKLTVSLPESDNYTIDSDSSYFTIYNKSTDEDCTHEKLSQVKAKDATCGEAGNREYWICDNCGLFFSDREGENEIEENSWIIPATGEHTPGVAVQENVKDSTCEKEGSYDEVVYCTVCKNELSREAKTIAKKDHTLVATPAKAATYDAAGNSAYWTCSECGKFFSDAEGTKEIAKDSWIIPKKVPANGASVSVAGATVTVTNAKAKTVTFTKAAAKAKNATVPKTVTVGGQAYKVTEVATNAFAGTNATAVTIEANVKKIAPNAFKGSKVKTVTVKTKSLKKKTVKNSLKGSKVKTVKVKVGNKKTNKKFVKKYKKIFTKKNAGKAVKVK
ncbi:MAG: leucine-rich repeat protein [Firmicutes bacterium]|nr:leucine-rich repeat protein [Bacillota bacterium]